MREELDSDPGMEIDPCDMSSHAESLAEFLRPVAKKLVVFHPVFLEQTGTWALAVNDTCFSVAQEVC